MTWTQETSGVIPIASGGQWFQNIITQKLFTKAGFNTSALTLFTQSVGTLVTTPIGSDRVQCDILLNE